VRPELGPSPPVLLPPQREVLCGVQNLAAVVELACAQERGLCQQWTECSSVARPFDDCLAERETLCRLVVY
jgi:hypothetical protein